MDVSVIVCTYNRASSLGYTLAALDRQEVAADLNWEIVIVDNNSKDSTPAAVEEFARASRAPAIYIHEDRQGLSFARNAGIAKSRGRIIAFTDDDVTPAANWLSTLVHSMKQYGADGIGGKILPQWFSEPPSWLMEDRSHALLERLALLDADELCFSQPGAPVKIFGANMAFSRSLFGELGTFDVELGRRGNKLYSHEERDFLERAVAAHKVIVYDPRIIVWHHIAAERMQKSYFRKWSLDDGEKKAVRVGRPDGWQIVGIPTRMFVFVLRDLTRWAWSVLRRSPKSFRRETKLWFYLGFVRFRVYDYFGFTGGEHRVT